MFALPFIRPRRILLGRTVLFFHFFMCSMLSFPFTILTQFHRLRILFAVLGGLVVDPLATRTLELD